MIVKNTGRKAEEFMKNTVFEGVATALITPLDENGIDYECAIKPFRKSDQSLMNMLLR